MLPVSMIAASVALAPPATISIIPQPWQVEPRSGVFTLNASTVIVAGSSEARVARQVQEALSPATGFELPIRTRANSNLIRLRRDTKLTDLGREGYRLTVESNQVLITAPEEAGLFYGLQTFRQLLPSAIFRRSPGVKADWKVPAVEITDRPRFSWRGGHLDVGRHFMPKEDVLKFIDLLAFHKMNTFHWHLTEDQGWRIEIKKYPKLTSVGAWRNDTMLTYSPPTYTGKPHGGYYTQDDIREVVAYAAARHITVVPEIEMPGHSQAAIAAYPELGNLNEPIPVGTKWGVIENVFNVEESTILFLQDVLTEVMALFPGQFIHIGGDECPKTQWKASPRVQARMKELGLKDEHEMQSWFIRRMDKFLSEKGRRLIGWSEILEGGLAEKAALMVWLGNDGAMTAVKSGHDVVMAQTSHTYFDYYQSKDTKKEPHAIGGFLPLDKVYSYEPILPEMTAEQAKHVLGVQFQTWTEYIPHMKHAEYMVFPRACALSEVAWSDKSRRNWDDFQTRLPVHLDRLTVLDVNYRKWDPGLGSASKPR